MGVNTVKRVRGRPFVLGLVAVFGAICCLGGSVGAAPPLHLPLVNPGFETGDFTGWTVYNSANDVGKGLPDIAPQSPSCADNQFAGRAPGAYVALDCPESVRYGFRQDVLMPEADDVVWSFWFKLIAWGWADDLGPAEFFAKISDGNQTVQYSIHWDGGPGGGWVESLPSGWTKEPWPAAGTFVGDIVTTDDLNNYFDSGDSLTVDFSGEAACSQHNAIMIQAVVDDTGPCPEPATMLLLALGGVPLLRRRRSKGERG